MRLHLFVLESTLSTVRNGQINDALTTNITGSPIIFRNGVHLGTYQVHEESPPPLAVSVTTQDFQKANQARVMAQPPPHLSVMDYPKVKPTFHLLAKCRRAVALPGEPLGLTTSVSHYIAL